MPHAVGTIVRPGVSAGGWTPASLPSLVALYQSNVPASITGSPVTQWNDLSGNGYHVTVQPGMVAPTTGVRTINGLNALGFDGSTQMLGTTSIASVGGNQHSFASIFLSDGVGSGFDRLLSLTGAAEEDFNHTGSIAAMLRDASTAAWNSYYNSTPRSTKAATDTTQHLLIVQRNGDSLDVYVDGVAGTTATGLGTAALNIARLGIGNAWNEPSPNHIGVAYYKGAGGLFAWSNTLWSAGDRASFLAYSQATWATP